MKQIIQRTILLIAGLLACFNVKATEIKVNNILYEINTADKTASVLPPTTYSYSGDIVIPENIVYQGESFTVTAIKGAFADCRYLTSVTLPNTITTIGYASFRNCITLSNIDIPNSVTTIDSEAFNGCISLTSIDIPNSVKIISQRVFKDCNSLMSVKISNSAIIIDKEAFYDCSSLKSIDIPNSVRTIGVSAFAGCSSSTSLNIGNSVKMIEKNAFDGCTNLTSIVIPNSVITIETSAFYGCEQLTTLTLGKAVANMMSRAFQGCKRLKEIYSLNPAPPTLNSDIPYDYSFDDFSATVYVPKGSLQAYKSAPLWKLFTQIKEMDATGIEHAQADGVSVIARQGVIEVVGATDAMIEVFNMNGQCIYRGKQTSIPVAQGAYIVRLGGTSHKVMM